MEIITFDHKAKVCPVILFVEISRIKASLDAARSHELTAVCLCFCRNLCELSGFSQLFDYIASVPLAISDIVVSASLQHSFRNGICYCDALRPQTVPAF